MIQREVVGVVADVKFSALSAVNVGRTYLPLEQNPWPATTLIVAAPPVRSARRCGARQNCRKSTRDLPITGVATMERVVALRGASAAHRAICWTLAGFALLLAAIGITA